MGRMRFGDFYPSLRPCRFLAFFLVVILSVARLPQLAASEATLDRLFFSLEDRSYLEILRDASSQTPSPIAEPPKELEVTETRPQLYTLGGTVTKKGGVQAIWLNGRTYPGTELPTYVEPHHPPLSGEIRLRAPATGRWYSLRPGQTLDINDGRIQESYDQGSSSQPVGGKAP